MTFTMSRSLHPLPEPRAALRALHEGIAAVAAGIRSHVVPLDDRQAGIAAPRLDDLAARLLAASGPRTGRDDSRCRRRRRQRSHRRRDTGGTAAARGVRVGCDRGGARPRSWCCVRGPALHSLRATACWARRGCSWPTSGPVAVPDEMHVEGWSTSPADLSVGRRSPTTGSRWRPREEPLPDVNELRLRETGLCRARRRRAGRHGSLLRATLCRCGASQNKPFCDGSQTPRSSSPPASRPAGIRKPLTERGAARDSPRARRPLAVSGSVEIAPPRPHDRSHDRDRLCRAAARAASHSATVPHARIGFRST